MKNPRVYVAIGVYIAALTLITYFIQQAAYNRAASPVTSAVAKAGAPASIKATPAASKAASGASAPVHGDAAKGQTAFSGTCAACHGAQAKGVTGLGKDLTSSAFAKGLNDAQLVSFIKQGRPSSDPANTTKVDMPPRGGNPSLSDGQLADIVAYLRTLQK